MSGPSQCLVFVFLWMLALDGVRCWYDDGYRIRGYADTRQRSISYPRDWDIDWGQRSWEERHRRHPGPGRRFEYWNQEDSDDTEYNYQEDFSTSKPVAQLSPRIEVVSNPKIDTRGVLHTEQRGSAVIPYHGATVHVSPSRTSSDKFYRGTITSTITNGSPKKKIQRSSRKKNRGLRYEQRQLSQDEPARRKVCARCPSDRAVLAKKGSTTVLMELPPVIPCHPWSSVDKVRSEVAIGPQPGEEIPEGSHKIVIELKHRRKVITTCVLRYNVIVRKCPGLELGPGVHSDCPLGKAWGAHCNLTCDPGYDLEGDSHTECTDELEWSGVMPDCVSTTACPKPVSPENGHLSCRTPHHQSIKPLDMLPDGSVCHFLCDPGYTIPPAQQHLTRTRCIAGSWDSDQDPVCIEANQLDEEEDEEDGEESPILSAEGSFRIGGEGCPQGFCQNGGQCLLILEEPMCSCKSGYSGPRCEEEEHLDPDPDESNTIS